MEWVAIALATLLPWVAPLGFPASIKGGFMILAVSGLLLAQSLVRDLWLLWRKKRQKMNPVNGRRMRCMCVESTLGTFGILAGTLASLLSLFREWILTPSTPQWSLTILLTLALGFFIRNLILVGPPWRIRTDPDHTSLVFTWRS